MSEHKKLYEICQKIGYEISNKYYIPKTKDFQIWLNNFKEDPPIKVNVREIIFTQEFDWALRKYITNTLGQDKAGVDLDIGIMASLDNPVSYLTNLLGIGENE